MVAGNPTHLFRSGSSTVCGIPTNVSTPEYPLVLTDSPLNVSCGLCDAILAFELEQALVTR